MTRAMAERCVVFVHAHPDDESLQTGGAMARYAAEGVHVGLITCTNGELGEVAEVPEIGTVEEVTARLGEVRRAELVEACKQMGDIDLRMLGFHDSGMEGTEANADPKAFVNQDLDEPARMILEIFDELRPQVVVTYNEYGFYGHPDHIRTHEATVRAIELAPFETPKLYYTSVPRGVLKSSRILAEQMGLDTDVFFTDEEIDALGTPDEQITTVIDASKYIDNKYAALAAHRTQLGTTAPFLGIPDEWRAAALGSEYYVLVRSGVGLPEGTESDFFERLS